MDIKTISIDAIGLSVRASNALHRSGISNVGEMMGCSEEDLSKIRNMGRKTIDEVLLKIDEYRKYEAEEGVPESEKTDKTDAAVLPEIPEDFRVFVKSDAGREYILSWIKERGYKTGKLELLSARAYNRLLLNGYTELDKIVFMSVDELMQVPRMDLMSAEEINKRCHQFLEEKKEDILLSLTEKHAAAEQDQKKMLHAMLHSPEYYGRILQYIKANDQETNTLPLPNRAKNRLLASGKTRLSDFLFMTRNELAAVSQMGSRSVDEILAFIDEYLIRNEARIMAVINGDDSMLYDDADIRDMVLGVYNDIGFGGVSLGELREKASILEDISDERLKYVIGKLLAEGKLEYVDYRCYRVYPRFIDSLEESSLVDDRNKIIIKRRLSGETLESIAADFEMTRERVRQIVNTNIRKIRKNHFASTGLTWFDEDYYRYFFETYECDRKDAEEWLGISRSTFSYLDLSGAEPGKKPLEEAPDDHGLDLGLRLKIKNYLNQNKLFLDGRWIKRARVDLEEFVVRKYCREDVSFDEYIRIYNDFLREQDVPYDESIYYTSDVIRTRENRLSGARFLLWKRNKQIRYYDIDGQDYTELLETLNLEAYENIEYSTWKFVRDYPEIMKKYDIRDQYELHNLLRKIIPEGSYHDFHCEKMPTIRFGTFDMKDAFMDLLIDNAPISQADFAELISEEYGFETSTITVNYLQPLASYYHQGMYTIDQKVMRSDNMETLLSELTEDFYYIDEIRKLYAVVVPGADLEEINPYNLKEMGFSVLSRYVYRNHSTLYDYFCDILTREDITDITPYRRKFAYVQAFSAAVVNLKNDLEILEFEPNQIISFRKLAAAGITKEDLQGFCDEVYEYVSDADCFSIQSIRKEGFDSELFELGFSDWFYANLLATDERFAFSRVFSNIVLCKGVEDITVQSFVEERIKRHGSIDVYDLLNELEEVYGCRIADKWDVIYKVRETDVYYDNFLDRMYANEGVYNREVDAAEGL